MGYKIFISYKYADDSVIPIDEKGIVREYVDYIQNELLDSDDNLNKGERDGESLNEFKNSTISTHLNDKIYDSSITIVLISSNMVDDKEETEQWIPYEISYSLSNYTRNDRISHSNAILAVVLPKNYDSNPYNYFMYKSNYYDYNWNKKGTFRTIRTNNTFDIIGNNMFNEKKPDTEQFYNYIHDSITIYKGDSSYISAVKWEDFIDNYQKYLDKALNIHDNIENYDIQKNI